VRAEKKLEWGKVIESARSPPPRPSKPRWVAPELLRKHEVGELPIWAPYEGESKGFHT
jgi:2'-hydroxyisoflavone reductase